MSAPDCHLVFADAYNASALARARAFGRVTVLDRPDGATLAKTLQDADALLVRTATLVTPALIEGAPRLRVIGRAGVGLENIDLPAARRRNITVVYTPSAATDAVADLTLGLVISLVRGIHAGDAFVRADRFDAGRSACVGSELSELTLGIVGLGRIGLAVARRCVNGFGMRVLYHDIVERGEAGFAAESVSLDRLLAEADVVSLHVPLTDRTRHMIGQDALSQLKTTTYLINTARGAVVDHEALALALSDGRLGGAGLDVVDPEPLPLHHPLLTSPNVVFTPHIAARTHCGLGRMNDVIDDVIGVLRGEAAKCPA